MHQECWQGGIPGGAESISEDQASGVGAILTRSNGQEMVVGVERKVAQESQRGGPAPHAHHNLEGIVIGIKTSNAK